MTATEYVDLDEAAVDPAAYGLTQEDIDTVSDPAAAIAAFTNSAKPDEPSIRKPGSGETTLFVGLEIDGELYKNAIVRELNGSDEEAISKLSTDKGVGLYYVQIEDMILKRAVQSIGAAKPTPDQLADLLVGDRGMLFQAVLIATYGETKEYNEVLCPHCEAVTDVEIDVPGLLDIRPMKTPEPFTQVQLRDGKLITIRYPTGRDQMQVILSKKDPTMQEQNTAMIARCIVNDNIPNRGDFALKMGAADRRKLVAAMKDNAPSVTFKEVSVPCPSCSEPIPFAFGWADLLFG